VVGESGSGKSTVGRSLVRLLPPGTKVDGEIQICGIDVKTAKGSSLRRLRKNVQMVFQDPNGSLNPRRSIGSVLADVLRANTRLTRVERKQRAAELLELVGLNPEHVDRRPHQFSGGQRQRISIASALAADPQLLICDEPVAALDVSVQAQVVNLLLRLQRELGLTIIFISHDINVVRHVSDEIAVMYLGKIVEIGVADAVFDSPSHPYTVSLIAAVPSIHSRPAETSSFHVRGEIGAGEPPSGGCQFRDRCWLYTQLGSPARCVDEDPSLAVGPVGALVACHFAGEVRQRVADEQPTVWEL
jgi:oligopeptide/dipeptide ABC transporter ATP-binding protein